MKDLLIWEDNDHFVWLHPWGPGTGLGAVGRLKSPMRLDSRLSSRVVMARGLAIWPAEPSSETGFPAKGLCNWCNLPSLRLGCGDQF